LVECPFPQPKGRIFAKLPAWKKPFQTLQRLQDAAQIGIQSAIAL
jgi:hypothetical protein